MWNTVFKEHKTQHPKCEGFLYWDLAREEQFGLVNREEAICDTCNYRSKKFKLYEEIQTNKRGRKAAKINESVQAALCQTPLGHLGLRKIILGCNIRAPSAAGLQKRANSVLPKIVEINKKDMKNRRKRLIEINKHRGRKNPGSVNLQGDAAYNNPLYSGVGKTPFQPATQVVYSVAETETEDKSIIAVVAKNKLCSVHPVGSGKQCTKECSSNITVMKSIGDEYTWAKEALQDLKGDDIEAKTFTTDPDSSAYRAATDLYEDNITNTDPEHFICTRHLVNNHRKNIKRNTDVLNVMPGRTKKEREKLQNNFANDLADRCQSEFTQALEKFGGNFQKIQNKISHICDAIISCYTGNHELCRRHSFVCKGGKKFWLSRRTFLPKKFRIYGSAANLDTIRKCVNYRLGPKALKQTRLNMNTQKVEGFNRSLRRSLPKNVTFTKNFEGRVHAAVHSVNLGPGESLIMICDQLGVPFSPGSTVETSLKKIQKDDKLQKQHKKTQKYRSSRVKKRNYLFGVYADHQEEEGYEKNKLLQDANRKLAANKKEEHSYAKKPRRRLRKL